MRAESYRLIDGLRRHALLSIPKSGRGFGSVFHHQLTIESLPSESDGGFLLRVDETDEFNLRPEWTRGELRHHSVPVHALM